MEKGKKDERKKKKDEEKKGGKGGKVRCKKRTGNWRNKCVMP